MKYKKKKKYRAYIYIYICFLDARRNARISSDIYLYINIIQIEIDVYRQIDRQIERDTDRQRLVEKEGDDEQKKTTQKRVINLQVSY